MSRRVRGRLVSVVVLVSEVRDELFSAHPSEGVLELLELHEEVVGRAKAGRAHRALEVEAKPLLRSRESCALGEVEEERQIEDQRRREDRVATQEIDLDLHRIS